MTKARHVEYKSSVCGLCGGTHYGSTECPYRCDRCKVKTDQCAEEGCPRNARFATENAVADERIVAAASKRTDAFVLREIAECTALAEGQKAFLRRLSITLPEATRMSEVENYIRRLMHSCPTHPDVVRVAIDLNALLAPSPPLAREPE